MDKFLIWGGNKLKGEVNISGSKNSVLPILTAAMLADSPSKIKRIPWLKDVDTMILILEALGIKIKRSFDGDVVIDPSELISWEAPYDLVRKMRSSIYVLGALLGRIGKAVVSMPGGCVIGPRPIDLHIKGLTQLGAKIITRHGYIIAEAPKLKGKQISLTGQFGSSVGATVNVLLASVKAEGTTIIQGAACEPDVVDLVQFLKKMGAKIEGEGSPTLKIKGVKTLHGAEHIVNPDRIETGTYMIAAAITGGSLVIKNTNPSLLESVIDKLRQTRLNISVKNDSISVKVTKKLIPADITTLPYPGFPTDLQAQFMALMSVTEGSSVIVEKIYPDRFMHVGELTRLGANIKMDNGSAYVKGVKKLSGAPVMASDLRASAALVLAGLIAEGETTINRVYHIDRGYEEIEDKLSKVGAQIKRVKSN